MRSYIDAVSFLFHLQQDHIKLDQVVVQTHSFAQLRYDHYSVIGAKNNPSILLVHGMAPQGNQDPRIKKLAASLALLNYQVWVPNFEMIAQFSISPDSISNIEQFVIQWHKFIGEKQRIALFSASFSAGLSLLAANRSSIQELISSICLVGGFSDVYQSIEYLLGDEQADQYGALIMLKNFFSHAFKEYPELEQALQLYIMTHSFETTVTFQDYHDYLNTLSHQAMRTLELLTESAPNRLRWWMMNKHSIDPQIKALNVIDHIKEVKAPIALLHGHDDRVIPAVQSVQLHHELNRYRRAHRLVVTSLLSHAEVKYELHLLWEIWQSIRTMNFYFYYCRKRRYLD